MWRYCFLFALLSGCLVLSESKEQNCVETLSTHTERQFLPVPAAIVFGNPSPKYFGRHRLYLRNTQVRHKKDQPKLRRRAQPKHDSAKATARKSFKHKRLYRMKLH